MGGRGRRGGGVLHLLRLLVFFICYMLLRLTVLFTITTLHHNCTVNRIKMTVISILFKFSPHNCRHLSTYWTYIMITYYYCSSKGTTKVKVEGPCDPRLKLQTGSFQALHKTFGANCKYWDNFSRCSCTKLFREDPQHDNTTRFSCVLKIHAPNST